MAVRDGPIDRARRRTAANLRKVAIEARRARVNAGLSQSDVAAAIGTSHSAISRFERGASANPGLELIAAYCGAVGLDLAMRVFPAGDAIRDTAHARLLERLRQELHRDLRWRTEVPFPSPGDPRSWDAITGTADWRIAIEAETVIDDTQALDRKLAIKRRDGLVGHLVLLIADTPRNRRALEAAPAAFADLPLRSRTILAALRRGANPGGSGIVML